MFHLFRYRLGGRSAKKLLGLSIITFIVLFFFIQATSKTVRYPWSPRKGSCSPQAYAAGSWSRHPRTTATRMTSHDDALAFSGFDKCAGSREYYWHLGSDKESQWDRFPDAQSWEWIPGKECEDMKPLNAENLLKDLVEDGGWYLAGDSVSENHFFSLSCILYPHVIAMPDFTVLPGYDHAWPQFLYLNPSSPLISKLSFPKGFNITSTPLVIHRRIDILLSKDELISIHKSVQPPNVTLEDTSLFSEEGIWTLPVAEYVDEFLAPLPKGNYATMVVSTAGHWTTSVFSKVEPPGIKGVLNLFEAAVERWSEEVQSALRMHARTDVFSDVSYPPWFRLWSQLPKQKERRVVIRAYLPGHEDCHNIRQPWDEVQPFKWNYYNWNEIRQFNALFEKVLLSRVRFPNIHYLGIDRPARLRPDAHASSDCLHIMAGAGVLEGWTHYIWQYISHEI